MTSSLHELLRDLGPRVLGAVVRRYHDLGACEDAVQEALFAASEQWPRDGLPAEPRAWLIHVANRRMADRVRAETARRLREEIVVSLVPPEEQLALAADEALAVERDDSLDLLFLCCQPALSRSSAVALTLRAVGGLTTAEIARAYLVPEATMGQRLARARQTVKDAGLVSEELSPEDRRQRLPSVMQVLYLVFNEGYSASSGGEVHRVDLAREALRLTRMLLRLMPETPEVMGLLALMLLTDARRAARTGSSGELIPLDEQDRSTWDRAAIAEGSALIHRAFEMGAVGPYQLQAAIAQLHDEATSTDTTDWKQISALYEVLLRFGDNPMVALNHVIARAMVEGPERGLERLEQLRSRLGEHHRFLSARAHLLERAGKKTQAIEAFVRAAGRTDNVPERDFLLLRAARLRG